jgi:hypothetical protein
VNGARVMNASWGSDEYSQALLDAIRVGDGSGSLFVAAAGNSFSNADTFPHYPSSYDVPNLISVAATDNRDQRAWFSNYGSRSVDLGAPGVGIYSTWPGAAYESLDGTSMAAPHVSGVAALVEAAFPGATAVGTKALLLRSVDLLPSLTGRTTTGGRLNANSAVRCTFNPELVVAAPQGAVDAYVGETVQLAVLAAACGDPAGVTVTASAGGLPIALSARGDGLFTGGYTLTAVGAVSIEVSASAGSTTDTKTISVAVSPSYTITPDGTPVTVTTTMAGQNARLTFSGNAGQRVTLKLSAGTIGQEKVSLLAPDGSTVFSSTYGNSGFVDVRTLAAAGSYALLVDPIGANTGSLTLALYDVPPDLAATISPGGPPANVSTTVPGQNARLVFTGNAGQRISLALSAGTVGQEKVTLLAPDGSTVFSSTFGNSGFVDVRTLASAGSYALLVDPIAANTGSLTLALYDVPPDFSSTISAGGPPVTMTTTVPGQNGRLTFSGNAGQRVSLKLSSGTMAQEKVSLLAPDGSTVFSSTFANTGFVDVRTLATSGGYTVVVDPAAANTGSLTVNLYDVPPDVAGTISAGGAAFTITTTASGQNATAVFSGNSGQRISLALSAGTMGQEKVSLLAPDGSTVFSSTFGNSGFVDVRTLAAAGSYALVVDPIGANAGSLTLSLYDVPPDTSSTISVGGAPATVRTTVPGQNALLTFSGNAGQALSLKLSGVTMSSTRVSILNPDTSTLVAPRTFGTAGGTVTVTLPTAGTYTIVVDPQVSATGSVTLTLT